MSVPLKALTETGSLAYCELSNDRKRAVAVAAALEVIAARVTTTTTHGTHLDREMNNLSKYADQIQEALKVK
ncbi:hypothetical protein FH041_07095 [Pseudomonas sp. SWI7]|jgi:hypothetical protein|uniref:hypothetical protein n=1 Tax=Pseudomonas sp. SWI7 TaxID=2587597 RepID=UPI00111D1812|nr:hypothetical protein [Pseudomonas sp. SWI7]QDC04706.1 hypothetical protein FH041_07095 [Pseudomonas sp. SWI7]